MPLSLSDHQLDIVTLAARQLPVEKRQAYLQRIAAYLNLKCGSRFSDQDVGLATQEALQSLLQRQRRTTAA